MENNRRRGSWLFEWIEMAGISPSHPPVSMVSSAHQLRFSRASFAPLAPPLPHQLRTIKPDSGGLSGCTGPCKQQQWARTLRNRRLLRLLPIISRHEDRRCPRCLYRATTTNTSQSGAKECYAQNSGQHSEVIYNQVCMLLRTVGLPILLRWDSVDLP